MRYETFKLLEQVGLYFFLSLLFLLIFLAINDVIKKNNVPKVGRYIVWLVLFLGMSSFLFKGLIEIYFHFKSIE